MRIIKILSKVFTPKPLYDEEDLRKLDVELTKKYEEIDFVKISESIGFDIPNEIQKLYSNKVGTYFNFKGDHFDLVTLDDSWIRLCKDMHGIDGVTFGSFVSGNYLSLVRDESDVFILLGDGELDKDGFNSERVEISDFLPTL